MNPMTMTWNRKVAEPGQAHLRPRDNDRECGSKCGRGKQICGPGHARRDQISIQP